MVNLLWSLLLVACLCACTLRAGKSSEMMCQKRLSTTRPRERERGDIPRGTCNSSHSSSSLSQLGSLLSLICALLCRCVRCVSVYTVWLNIWNALLMNIYFNTLLIFGSLPFVCFVLQVDKRKQCADSCWLRSLAGQKTTRIINRQQPAKLQPTTNNNNNNIDFYIRNAFLKANKGNALHANIAASSLEATSHSHTHTQTHHIHYNTLHTPTHTQLDW